MAPFVPVRPSPRAAAAAARDAAAAPDAGPAAAAPPTTAVGGRPLTFISEGFKDCVVDKLLRAVKGVYDEKWSRLKEDIHATAGSSFDDDFARVVAMFSKYQPCAVLVRSKGADVRTKGGTAPVAIGDNQFVLVVWVPETAAPRLKTAFEGVPQGIKQEFPTLQIKDIIVADLSEITLDRLKQAIGELARDMQSAKPSKDC